MLLLLFNGHIQPSVVIGEAVITAPTATYGYTIDRPAADGVWRMALELGDPAAGEAFVWHDVTQFYAGDSYQRGANEYLGKYAAAVAQLQLQTDNDDLAPWGQDTSDLFGVDVPLDAGLLMRLGMFRVVSGVTVEWNPLWTGRVETWGDASAARGQIRTHIITVTDTIADLANVPTTIEANAVPISEWLTENLTDAAWLFGIDFYGDDDADMPQDLTATAAIIRMDQATDPNGLVWRSRRTGRLISYPAPWDTTNTARWANPLLDSYPSGLVFSFSPDFTDIAYIDDDDQQPFGIPRTSLGVLNDFAVTTPSDLWLEDDPVSKARYGVRPFVATWIVNAVEQVVVDLLDARAYSSAQALPLRTSLDQEGFWSALAIVDHLDPVTIIHATTDDGHVVTAPGVIRNVTEQRTVRGIDDAGVRLLTWQSTVQVDVDATVTSPALLPVEDLALVGMNTPLLGGPSSAEFSWTNPVQPDITPTNVQLRVLGRSLIWFDVDYPGVGADGALLGFLSAATPYTLQVRLIRRDAGTITAFSATRSINFTTPALILPQFVPDGDSTDVIVGEPPDFDSEDCVLEVELQENDGTGWVTIDTFEQDDLVQNDDGTWSLIYPIPNSTFVNDRIYRFRSREVCGGIDGQWFTGSSFDPPDDWTDPCVEPPQLSVPPYDDSSLLVYVPKVCQGDDIVEAVSGISGVKGDAFAGFVQMLDEPDRIALLAVDDPEWSDTPDGILAYGECPQINGETGSKSISVYVNVADAINCVLFECAGMRILCSAVTTATWRATVVVYLANGTTVSLPSASVLDIDTSYTILASHDTATGDTTLNIDGLEDNSVGGSDNILTTTVLPIWRVGAPPGSWITDCAVWSDVVVVPGLVGAVHWWDFSNAASRTDVGGGGVGAIADLIGSATMTASGGADVARVTTLGGQGLTSALCTTHGGGAGDRMTATAMALGNLPVWVSWIGRATNGVYFWNSGTGGSVHAFAGTPSYIAVSTALNSAALSTGAPDIFYAEYNGASSKLYVNGVLTVSGTTGTASALSGNGALFNQFAGGTGGQVALGEIVMGVGTNSGADITAEYNRLSNKWI